jgi:hypothetical protein
MFISNEYILIYTQKSVIPGGGGVLPVQHGTFACSAESRGSGASVDHHAAALVSPK